MVGVSEYFLEVVLVLENKLYNSLILIVMQLFGPVINPRHNFHRHLPV